MQFKTTNNLDFEVADWEISMDFQRFRVGTCEGLFGATNTTYDILAVTNNQPNNGHFNDVLEWFENSCKRDKKDLRILEVWNDKFKKHLIDKKGFVAQGEDNVIKKYK